MLSGVQPRGALTASSSASGESTGTLCCAIKPQQSGRDTSGILCRYSPQRKSKHGQEFAYAIPLAAALEHTAALMMWHSLSGITVRFRRRSSHANIRDGGLPESPLTSPDIPLGVDVDISGSGPENLAQDQEDPAPSSNEDDLDYNGSSIPSEFFSDDPR